MLPGVHRVRKTLSGGRRREFWYAWRGGPQILVATAASDAALDREVERLASSAATKYDTARTRPEDKVTFHGLVTRYLIFLEGVADEALSPRTKSDRRKYLDVARRDLGSMEIRAFESRKARGLLIGWRDSYQHIPKTADERLGAVSMVLDWAADRGELAANPVKDFPRIYKVNRADVIWEPHHDAILLEGAAQEFDHAVRLANLTALRESDLVKLPKTAIGQDAIIWHTGKSRGRRTVVIPITPPLRQLLSEIPPSDSVTVLVSSRGRPWTVSGLAAALRRQRIAALERAQATHGADAKSGIEGLRWHDRRGTAATNFLLNGLEIDDVALVLGWEPERVRQIAARYVTGEAMGRAMVKRLQRNTPKTKTVNGAVNGGSRSGRKSR